MMVAPSDPIEEEIDDSSSTKPYQEEMCEKLIQLSFAKIVNSKSERGGARLHKNLLILHLLQKARWEQRSRLLHASAPMDTTSHVSESPQQSRDNMETEREEEETGIEIDETSSQQQEEEDVFESKKIDIDEGTFSDRLTTTTPVASGFDGNDCPETIVERPQQASTPRQIREGDDFDFAIESNNDGSRHQNGNRSHRRRRSASAKLNRSFVRRKNSSSSSSSSSDSDESSSSSSEENYSTTQKTNVEKCRDSNLKRKLDDCDVSNNRNSNLSQHTCDWYSSHPTKMACHGGQTDQNTFQNHQNLSGLISVLQSAALTSDESTSAQLKEDTQLAFYETDTGDGSSLQRSLSCPGLLELTCES
jgi:hypothetical protein